ncbi:MAG: YtxH domain-containing protein [Patescibacteria group bacterium]|nr:YtxH domain-containing protein [Patescibacteria group bacterium]
MKKNGEMMLGGALVGAVLGVAAGVLLAPESGKKMRRDIRKLSGDFYRYLAPQIKRLKKVSETQYHAFVTEGVKKYADAKKLSLAEVKIIASEAKRSWGHMKKNLR